MPFTDACLTQAVIDDLELLGIHDSDVGIALSKLKELADKQWDGYALNRALRDDSLTSLQQAARRSYLASLLYREAAAQLVVYEHGYRLVARPERDGSEKGLCKYCTRPEANRVFSMCDYHIVCDRAAGKTMLPDLVYRETMASLSNPPAQPSVDRTLAGTEE